MTDITANVVVSMPSQLFTMARSFKAVANGKIYIGKIDTDPVNPENQIQVYVENEDGSHVPVSQPIIINAAGYPVYNGQIAKFVTVEGHSMAVYDSYGTQQFYYPNVLKYDPDRLRSDLSTDIGSTMVGANDGRNIQEWLDYSDGKIKTLESIVEQDIPPFEYSSGVHLSPILQNGSSVEPIKLVAPTDLDFNYASEINFNSEQPLINIGITGLTSGKGFSQDFYAVRNLTISNSSPKIIEVEPYCGLMLDVDRLKITNTGDVNSYIVNLKHQNWWPLISNNVVADNSGKGFNFLKAIDDEGSTGTGRFSGNSRCVITNNRLKWHGGVGGIGFYTSAVATSYKNNAIEGCKIGIRLGYPSFSTKIRDTYCELPRKDSTLILIGDDEPTTATSTINSVVIDGVYVNAHNFESNAIIKVSDGSVISRLNIDNIFTSGVYSNQPLIQLNDIAGNSINCGTIVSSGNPLINMTRNNPVVVNDIYSQYIHQLNADCIGLSIGESTIPANSSENVRSSNIFVRSASPASVNVFNVSSSDSVFLRGSRRAISLSATSGSKSVYYYIAARDLVGFCTIQAFVKTKSTESKVTVYLIKKGTGVVGSKEFDTTNDWREVSFSAYINTRDVSVDDNVYFVQVNTIDEELHVTGLRTYKGQTALCVSPAKLNTAETQRLVAQTTYPAP